MNAELPTVTHTGEFELLGHMVTVHQLSDGRRVYADTPEFRAMLAELGTVIDSDGRVLVGVEQAIEVER